MSIQFNPPHPGITLRDDVLPELGLTVTDAARQLDVTRTAFSRIINGRAAISPEMALRIEAWLGADRGGRADLWLAGQAVYDLWQARHAPEVQRRVQRTQPVAA
ncbi:MAG: HigA family addiction module antitoxin [Desulfovibrionaceae bacterium]|jgi:addiction module HigA family antidote|nr:HigA family addiction module antitoxin [Desulfovibrionaceae bacterium]